MSRRSCCVPGCSVTVNDGVPFHKFPDPKSNVEKFNAWVSNIGGSIATLDTATIYYNRRVCHKHFKDVYRYPKNKLCKLAIPELHIPGPSLTTAISEEVAVASTSGVENIFMPGYQRVLDAETMKTEQHVEHREKQKKKTNISRGTRISLSQHQEYNAVLKQLKKCEKDKQFFKTKYFAARKLKNTTAFKIISKNMSATAKILCQMQATQSGKKKKGRRFTLDEKILALSLYKPSPKAYRLLSKLCVLPSRKTLQNLLYKVNLKAGINKLIFENLKTRVATMPANHKYCTLIFDEMAIGPAVLYNKRNDQIIGLVDNGQKNEKDYCDHVLVFMVRGIIKKYKQPLAYYFCSGSTKANELKSLLKNMIRNLQEAGLKVVATVCDQSASNLAAVNSLLKETRARYIKNNKRYTEGFFTVGKTKVFPIYDPPHLLKGVRNNLLTKDLHYYMKGKARVAKWSHLIQLYKRNLNYDGVKMVPKLTAHHVLPNLIPKMRVKHCTQVFSKTVGVTLGLMAELGAIDKDCEDTAKLLMFFDNLFDSVNGSFSKVKGGKIYRAALTPTSPHHKLWNESLPILKSMKFINANNQGVVPSLASWIKTIENFKRLAKFLYGKGVNSLLLRNVNQDALENFFGAIRAHGYSNIMPTASAFEGAFKTLLINNITSSHSVGANCEKDDSVCLQSLKQFLMKPGNNSPTQCVDEIESVHLNLNLPNTDELIKSSNPAHIEKCAVIGYCSGWMAQLAKKHIYKGCATCKNDLEAEDIQSFHNYIEKKEYENKKWLCYPTRTLFDFFAQVESICLYILKEYCNKKNICNYIKLIINVNLNLSFLNCADHKQDLIKYLIDKSTIFFINNWCKNINSILNGKNVFMNVDVGDVMKEKALRHYSKNKGRKRHRQNDVVLNV